jgi:hypothetical protein
MTSLAWLCVVAAMVFIIWRSAKSPKYSAQVQNQKKNRDDALERREIIKTFGSFIEKNPPLPTRIEDVNVLPYPKDKILDSLMVEIAFAQTEEECDHLEGGAVFLAQYQEGVGIEALEMLGLDIAKLSEAKTPEEIQRQAIQIAEASKKNEGRFEAFNQLVETDLERIRKLANAARRLRKQLPAEKKKELQGF